MQRNISVYGAERDAAAAIINWRFTAKDARAKLRRLHPDTSTFTRRWPLSEVHRKMEGAQGSPASTGGCVAGRPKPSWGAWTSKSVSASRARQPHRMTLPPKILGVRQLPRGRLTQTIAMRWSVNFPAGIAWGSWFRFEGHLLAAGGPGLRLQRPRRRKSLAVLVFSTANSRRKTVSDTRSSGSILPSSTKCRIAAADFSKLRT